MKVIAEAKYPICLMDPTTRDLVSDDRPRVVYWTQFIETRCGKGELRVLQSDLPDSASDDEFVSFLEEYSDPEHAVASFTSCILGETPETNRETLEAEARELGVEFRSNLSTEKLAERIARAKE